MPVATWPATLPQAPLLEGYSRGEGKAVLRTDMDAGPDKLRRRSTGVPAPLQYAVAASTAQLAIFRAFWRDDLQQGALPYYLPDPEDGEETLLVRFLEEPSWTPLPAPDPDGPAGAKMWRLALQLEILP